MFRVIRLCPQYCTMPTFTQKQHIVEVHNELQDTIIHLNKKARNKVIKTVEESIDKNEEDDDIQRVEEEGEVVTNNQSRRVEPTP